MPDKDDDLLFDEDLTADFLGVEEKAPLAGVNQPPVASSSDSVEDIPAPSDLGASTSDPKVEPAAQTSSPNTPSAEEFSGENSDWIEDAKVDLPGQLALDIYETRNDLIVLCRVAGVDEKKIDVSISADNILNIRGTLMTPQVETNIDNYFIQECYWGEFSRSVSLPVDVKKDNIDATLENGILVIKFIKIKQDSIKKINIKTNKSPQ